MNIKTIKFNADVLGILSAALCVIHCAALPILIFFSSYNAASLVGDWHWLHYFFILLSVLAVFWSSKKATAPIRILLWGFFILFSIALLLHEVVPQAIYVSVSASIGLVIVHSVNQWKKIGCSPKN